MANDKKERNVAFQDERRPVVVHYDIELDDAGLDPYQFRTYQRIARRCAGLQQGECFESLGAMAADCKMSRPTIVRAIRVLIQRQMIRRLSRQGETSFYALTDKETWLPFAEWERLYSKQPGKPEIQVKDEPDKPEIQGVVKERATTRSMRDSGGGSVVSTKNTHEEYTEEIVTTGAKISAAAIFEKYANRSISIQETELFNSEIKPAQFEAWAEFVRLWFVSYPYSKQAVKPFSVFCEQQKQATTRTQSGGLPYNFKTHYSDGREKPKGMRNFVC